MSTVNGNANGATWNANVANGPPEKPKPEPKKAAPKKKTKPKE